MLSDDVSAVAGAWARQCWHGTMLRRGENGNQRGGHRSLLTEALSSATCRCVAGQNRAAARNADLAAH